MADVFLSYAREDAERAKKIHDGLTARGLNVFYDAKILGGEPWPERLEIELDKAKCVIICLSAQATKSTGVREETERALRAERELTARSSKALPVLFDPGLEDQLPFGLQRIQSVSLINWDGTPGHNDWSKLEESVWAFVVPQWYREQVDHREKSLRSELLSRKATLDSKQTILDYATQERIEAVREAERCAAENQTLAEKLRVNKNALDGLAQEIRNCNAEMATLIADNKVLKATVDDTQKAVDDARNRIGTLQEDNTSLRNQRDELHRQNAEILAQRDQAMDGVKDLIKANSELTVDRNQTRNLLGGALNDNQRLEQENQGLRSKLGPLEKEVEGLKLTNGQLDSERERLAQECSLQEAELEQRRQLNERLQVESLQLKEHRDQRAVKVQQLEQSISDLKKDNEQLKKGRDPLEPVLEQLRKTNADLQESNKKLATASRQLTANGEGLTKTNVQLGAQNQQLTQANSQLGAQVLQLKGRVGVFRRRMHATAIAALFLAFVSGILLTWHPGNSNGEIITGLQENLIRARNDNAKLEKSLTDLRGTIKGAEDAAALLKQKAKTAEDTNTELRRRAKRAEAELQVERASKHVTTSSIPAPMPVIPTAAYYVGVESYGSRANAEQALAEIKRRLRDNMIDGLEAEISSVNISDLTMHRVMIGKFRNRSGASDFCGSIAKREGWEGCWVFDEKELASYRIPAER